MFCIAVAYANADGPISYGIQAFENTVGNAANTWVDLTKGTIDTLLNSGRRNQGQGRNTGFGNNGNGNGNNNNNQGGFGGQQQNANPGFGNNGNGNNNQGQGGGPQQNSNPGFDKNGNGNSNQGQGGFGGPQQNGNPGFGNNSNNNQGVLGPLASILGGMYVSLKVMQTKMVFVLKIFVQHKHSNTN